jgi:hypothetical protein
MHDDATIITITFYVHGRRPLVDPVPCIFCLALFALLMVPTTNSYSDSSSLPDDVRICGTPAAVVCGLFCLFRGCVWLVVRPNAVQPSPLFPAILIQKEHDGKGKRGLFGHHSTWSSPSSSGQQQLLQLQLQLQQLLRLQQSASYFWQVP